MMHTIYKRKQDWLDKVHLVVRKLLPGWKTEIDSQIFQQLT